MFFIEVFLLITSILLIAVIAWYSFHMKATRGAFAAGLLMTAALVWSFGALFQLWAESFQWMLFWRNFQQIGVFGVPALSLYFAISYTMSQKLKPFMKGVAIVSSLTVLLIFTNDYHGLMRSAYEIESTPLFDHVLVVTLTTFGMVMVTYNFLLPLVAIGVLGNFYTKVAPGYKKSVAWLMVAMVLTFVGILLKEALLRDMGFHVSIATFYAPSSVIFFYVLYRKQLFALSPVARDKVFHVIEQGIFVFDLEGKLIDVNQHGKEIGENIHGKKVELGENVFEAFKEKPLLVEFLRNQDQPQFQHLTEGGEGPRYFDFERYWLSPEDSKSGEKERPLGQVLLVKEVTEKKVQELILKDLAETDGLTGLLNRRTFQYYAEQGIALAKEKSIPVAFLIIDLDHFKKINDVFGHPVGDKVIQEFAQGLRDHLRRDEVIGRLGGEEFGVFFFGENRQSAYAIAERIRLGAEKMKISAGEVDVSFTISIGLTVKDSSKTNYEDLYHESDQALYEAKAAKRNCTVVYQDLQDH